MKQFFQNNFTKIKDYFTANMGRKIFFWGLIIAIFGFIVFGVCRLALPTISDSFYFVVVQLINAVWVLTKIAMVVAGVGTLWDSMDARVQFLKKVKEIQYNHLKTIHEKQQAGESVEMTATFSDKEKRYLSGRKWSFIFIILLKVCIVIALFSLLLKA